ncbi:hypothetical protein FRC07_011673 [Ceratobasidium sp. 392]|nr:hypothetical protein FRC07_011673 [Ceratobasidium sp. 392]
MPSELQVIVSGIKFVLTQDQFKVDGPNYFTDAVAAHTGHFRGPQVKVSRNPELFKLVVDFLNGYDVMPQGAPLPAGIASRKVALRNLIAEAKFYRLSSLENIAQEGLRQLETRSVTRHVMLSRKATTDDWGLPSFIASDVAKELREEHGISAYSEYGSFRLKAAWEEPSDGDTIQTIILSIAPN